MKFEELAINDWVLWNGTPKQVKEVGLSGIGFDSDEGNVINFVFETENISPMPLTREIFNKNKYRYVPNTGCYFTTSGSQLNLCFYRLNDKEWGFNLGFKKDGEKDDITIRYVHELQCILRAYKEYEMAKSFKV